MDSFVLTIPWFLIAVICVLLLAAVALLIVLLVLHSRRSRRTPAGERATGGRVPNDRSYAQPSDTATRFCPHCGTQTQSGHRFCAGCGGELPDVKPVDSAGVAAPDPYGPVEEEDPDSWLDL